MATKFITHQQREYDEVYKTFENEYGFPDRKISDTMELYGKMILNLGCGAGNDSWYLSEKNTIIGLDYASSGLLIGKAHGLHGVQGDLNIRPILPFKDQSFDVVICKDILEHVIDPLTVLREATRILKDTGYIVISVPNHFYLPLRLRILLGKGMIWKSSGSDHTLHYEEWNYMHIRYFTYKGFKEFLEVTGLKIDKWFWDFGVLAHYHNPDMWLEPQLWKKSQNIPLTRRGKIGIYLIKPLWEIVNLLFPRTIRSKVVSWMPGLLCAGFYTRVRKK